MKTNILSNIKTIFHLDDLVAAQESLQKDLADLSYKGEYLSAVNIKEAKEIISAHDHFDLVFLDYNLPDGKGKELIRLLDKKTKIIMMSTHDETEKIIDCIEEGANDYICKPWDVEELVTKLESVINN
jgi:DNA-binding response OmpR family regulator